MTIPQVSHLDGRVQCAVPTAACEERIPSVETSPPVAAPQPSTWPDLSTFHLSASALSQALAVVEAAERLAQTLSQAADRQHQTTELENRVKAALERLPAPALYALIWTELRHPELAVLQDWAELVLSQKIGEAREPEPGSPEAFRDEYRSNDLDDLRCLLELLEEDYAGRPSTPEHESELAGIKLLVAELEQDEADKGSVAYLQRKLRRADSNALTFVVEHPQHFPAHHEAAKLELARRQREGEPDGLFPYHPEFVGTGPEPRIGGRWSAIKPSGERRCSYGDASDLPMYVGAPRYTDVLQAPSLGTCYVLGALAALAERTPELLPLLFREQADGTIVTELHHLQEHGEYRREQVTVDRFLPALTYDADRPVQDRLIYARGRRFDADGRMAIWPALAEKVFAARDGKHYGTIEGGEPGAILKLLLGELVTNRNLYTSQVGPNKIWERAAAARQAHFPVTAFTPTAFTPTKVSNEVRGFVRRNHAFAVVGHRELSDGSRWLRLYDSHAHDNETSPAPQGIEWLGKGEFWITAQRFAQVFKTLTVHELAPNTEVVIRSRVGPGQ